MRFGCAAGLITLIGWLTVLPVFAQTATPQLTQPASAPPKTEDMAPPRPRAIVGGKPVEDGAYRFMVQIGIKRRDAAKNAPAEHICGGSLISDRLILTAAHCFTPSISPYRRKNHDIYVFVGSVETTRALAIKIERLPILHPEWRGEFHDLAMLVLPSGRVKDVKARKVAPVRLASVTDEKNFVQTGRMLFVTGWGKTETTDVSRVLREADLKIKDRDICRKNWQEDFRRRNVNWRPTQSTPEAPSPVDDSMICAADAVEQGPTKDSCNGDSGGPLLIDSDLQVGIVAGGGLECAAPGLYGVYTRVAAYLPWIAEMKAAFK